LSRAITGLFSGLKTEAPLTWIEWIIIQGKTNHAYGNTHPGRMIKHSVDHNRAVSGSGATHGLAMLEKYDHCHYRKRIISIERLDNSAMLEKHP